MDSSGSRLFLQLLSKILNTSGCGQAARSMGAEATVSWRLYGVQRLLGQRQCILKGALFFSCLIAQTSIISFACKAPWEPIVSVLAGQVPGIGGCKQVSGLMLVLASWKHVNMPLYIQKQSSHRLCMCHPWADGATAFMHFTASVAGSRRVSRRVRGLWQTRTVFSPALMLFVR